MKEQDSSSLDTREWLEKAERDLASARKLAYGEDTLLDYAAFHCQQVAEKAVKAVLVYKLKEWDKRKGHDILYLIHLAGEFYPDIGSRARERGLLTPLAVNPRYPDFPSITRKEFDWFLNNAEEFYKYILSILPTNLHPTKRGVQ